MKEHDLLNYDPKDEFKRLILYSTRLLRQSPHLRDNHTKCDTFTPVISAIRTLPEGSNLVRLVQKLYHQVATQGGSLPGQADINSTFYFLNEISNSQC